jgi:hypothetical protein
VSQAINGAPDSHAHSGSGPVVWVAIIATTCLLLLVFQKVLWLVVPFLLALILYYFLFPLVRRLVFRGMSRDAASSAVILAFLALLALAIISLTPKIAAQATQWQNTVDRYVQGGTMLLDSSLRSLERALADPGARQAGRYRGRSACRMAPATSADHLEPVALGIMAWTPSLLAGALPGLLLPARRPPLQALSRRRRAERLFRKDALPAA